MFTCRLKPLFVLLGTTLCLAMLTGAAQAQSLMLKAPSLANMHGRLTARFGVAVEEIPILKGELDDGVQLVLKCRIRLSKDNDYWLDNKVSEANFKSEIKYDALAQEYVMTLPDREKPLKSKDLKQILTKGWGTIETILGPWTLLDRGQKYSLRVSTSMNEKDAPEGVMRFIYFWSWDAGSNNTFQLDFTF